MLSSFLSAIASFFGLVSGLVSFFTRRSDRQEGREEGDEEKTLSDATAALAASQRELEADVDAPKTAQELEALLDKGEA